MCWPSLSCVGRSGLGVSASREKMEPSRSYGGGIAEYFMKRQLCLSTNKLPEASPKTTGKTLPQPREHYGAVGIRGGMRKRRRGRRACDSRGEWPSGHNI
ncbi:hypothetical protein AALO_G00145110 [Alosa alosa]|uniref:Uncharacterized protein n=1 Tax=Alosa alosa TaxID=278164 RepID=A0AAV6GJZ6_9TELE|nr:hypothetical protein AALO_G00145110 [Alosa alosa]